MNKKTYRRFDPWRPAPVREQSREQSREQLIDGHYFTVERVSLSSSTSSRFDRLILRENHGDTIGILAQTPDGSIPLVEQYRLPSHRWTLEIPAGHAHLDHEKPVDVALRKLRQEAGYDAGHISQFMRFLNTPSFSTQHTSLFYATDLSTVDRGEIGPESPRSNVRLVSPDDAYDMVIRGVVIDAKSIIAIMRLHEGLRHPQTGPSAE